MPCLPTLPMVTHAAAVAEVIERPPDDREESQGVQVARKEARRH